MTSTQHQPSLVCSVKHHILVDFSASVNVPSIIRPEKQFFNTNSGMGWSFKNTEWKGLHDGVRNASSVFYYFYSTMANTVVNGIHVKGMITLGNLKITLTDSL